MSLQDGSSAVLELSELGKKLPLEQMRRRHDLAVSDADDGWDALAIRVEHLPVFLRCHERLIGKREHRGRAVGEMLDRGAERTPHTAGEIQVDRMSSGKTVECCRRPFVIAPKHNQHIVEAGVADVSHCSTDERLVTKRQKEFLNTHPRRRTRSEYHRADHNDV